MSHDLNCFYCTKDQRLQDMMIEIAPLEVSTVYLFKDQTYHGRCVVALGRHERESFELPPAERAAYFNDVARVAKAISLAYQPAKINYGIYGDLVPHIHCHIVPKYEGGRNWGGTFDMKPGEKYLTEAEYNQMIETLKKYL